MGVDALLMRARDFWKYFALGFAGSGIAFALLVVVVAWTTGHY
jgi:hypothetical protein